MARRMQLDPERDPRAAIAAAAMAAAASIAFDRWVRAGGRGNPADAVGDALTLVEQGLHSLDISSD